MNFPPTGRINLVVLGVFLLFLVLKLTGNVQWNWWIIFAPLFVWLALVLAGRE